MGAPTSAGAGVRLAAGAELDSVERHRVVVGRSGPHVSVRLDVDAPERVPAHRGEAQLVRRAVAGGQHEHAVEPDGSGGAVRGRGRLATHVAAQVYDALRVLVETGPRTPRPVDPRP